MTLSNNTQDPARVDLVVVDLAAVLAEVDPMRADLAVRADLADLGVADLVAAVAKDLTDPSVLSSD